MLTNQIIYITSPDSQQIHVWGMDQNESLTLIQTLNTSSLVHPIIIHPNKKILYVGTRPIPKIFSFSIEKNGYLKKKSEFLIPAYSTHLTINRTGTILYSASYIDNSLSIIKLDDLGNFIIISQTLKGLLGCHSSKIEINNNSNKRIWVPCLKEDCIRLYNINQDQTLDEDSLKKIIIDSHSGPRHMVFNYTYSCAYIINELNSNISVIKIDSSIYHLPRVVQTINIVPNNYHYNDNKNNYWASDIHITPNNRWIYCCDRYANIISYLEILNNNELKFRGYQSTEIQPRGFTIDNQGKYLFVAGQKSNFVSIYKIDNKSGRLKLSSRFPTGKGPVWITTLI